MQEVQWPSDEAWKPIVGWEDLYEVSDHGRVRSLRSSRGPRKQPRLRKLWIGKTNGYPSITLYKDGERVGKLVHRLVLEAFVGPCSEGLECCHRDDVKTNNTLENLYWGSKKDQLSDAVRNLRLRRGEAINTAQVTESQVREIRKRYAAGETQAELARAFGVTLNLVHFVVTRRTWKHVT